MKKSIRVLMIILVIVIILWLIAFSIDYYRCSNLNTPIFVLTSLHPDVAYSNGREDFSYYCLGYNVNLSKIRRTSNLVRNVYI